MCDKNCDCNGSCGDGCKCHEQKEKKTNFPFKRNDFACICDPDKDMDEAPNKNCPVHKIKR